jgi:hypothetical protein
MDFKVEFKDSFVDDLEQIVQRIAAHNPDAARMANRNAVSASSPGLPLQLPWVKSIR